MDMLTLYQGKKVDAFVSYQEDKIVPFIGAKILGDCQVLGYGFKVLGQEEEKVYFWDSSQSCNIVRLWRSLKLLETLEFVDDAKLSICWSLMQEDIHAVDKDRYKDLAQQFLSAEEFEKIRKEILNSILPINELITMMRLCSAYDILVDTDELGHEYISKRGVNEYLLIKLICEQRMKQRYSMGLKVLPKEESLGSLFEDMKIDDLIIGSNMGTYGHDWGYIGLSELDEAVICQSDKVQKWFKLECIKSGRTPAYPYFTSLDGTEYIFLFARYIDGVIYIQAEVGKNGERPRRKEYAVKALRKEVFLEENEKKGGMINGAVSFLASLFY